MLVHIFVYVLELVNVHIVNVLIQTHILVLVNAIN
jgi:hypothetical protein